MYIQVGKFAIGAEYYETSRSWGHKAHLYLKTEPALADEYLESEKIRYYNRTWESYKFQTVIQSLIDKACRKQKITRQEADELQQFFKEYRPESELKSVAMVAMLGDIFGKTTEQKNDWKERMLKAGLPEGAIQMPEDWSELSEVEKQRRLDGAIKAIS